MYRRSLLVAGATAFAGCAFGPSPPTTDGYPQTPPNFVGAFAWLPDESAYRVRFDAGNVIEAPDAARVAVVAGEPRVDRTWVGSDDPAVAFPLEPGDELTVGVDAPDDVTVVWTAPDENRSVALDGWPLDDQPAGGR